MNKYELIIIGSGPAGVSAALKATSFGHKVAVIEIKQACGVGQPSDNLPSKILNELSLFSGKDESGIDHLLKRQATAANFRYRKNYIPSSSESHYREKFRQHGIDLYSGAVSFENPNTLKVAGEKKALLQGRHLILATGSFPFHPPHIPFDGKRIHDADTILRLTTFPKTLCIVGAGVIGCEYTTIFSSLGTKVILINDREKILPQIDREVSNELLYQMKHKGVEIHLNTTVKAIEKPTNDNEPLNIFLDNGTLLQSDLFLFAAGRLGNTATLGCDTIGLKLGPRQTVDVDAAYRTNLPHIYAVGDVIGFASLASTGGDQGRLAVTHMFHQEQKEKLPKVLPYGIYTVPEITMTGLTEEEAQTQDIDYCTGTAHYKETVRSQIIGIDRGFLKLVFNPRDLQILGIHLIGPFATEIIHYGIELMENKKTLNYIEDDLFNYPSLHELYKLAAQNGLQALAHK